MNKIVFFWVPVDPLPIIERINLRKNYLRSIESGSEKPLIPKLKDEAEKIAKAALIEIEVPSYLTPFPEISDFPLISEKTYREFIKNEGLKKVSEKLEIEIKNNNGLPFIISPDHSVTYGAVKALHKKWGTIKVIIFDAHLDTVSPDISLDALHTGNFIRYLYYGGTTSITVLGVQDDPELNPEIYESIPIEIKRAYPEWKKKINIYNINELKNRADEILQREIVEAKEEKIYISIDIDFASGSDLWGVRFFEGRGMSWERSLEILREAITLIKKSGKNLVGIDFTEWDPMLMEIPLRGGKEDKVVEIFRGVVEEVKKF